MMTAPADNVFAGWRNAVTWQHLKLGTRQQDGQDEHRHCSPLRRLVACAALAAMVWGTPATQASPALASLHYLTEEYKPYNFTGEDGAPTGFAIDLLHLVWQKTGTPVQPVSILPRARGYYLLTQKPNVVLFSTARTEARNPLFKWACPIGYAEIVLMGLASRP